MKQLIIAQNVVANLTFFEDKEIAICNEFCKIVVDFLIQGEVNPKLYNAAAAKLGCHPNQIRDAVESLMVIFREASKLNLNENELKEILSHYNINDNLSSTIIEFYLKSVQDLRECVKAMIPRLLPSYKNLDWRFEVNVRLDHVIDEEEKVATRSVRNICEPMIVLNFTLLDKDNKLKDYVFEMDASTLVHMTQEMEKAAAQLKSREYRKLSKFIR